MGWIGALIAPPEARRGPFAANTEALVPTIDTGLSGVIRDGVKDSKVYFRTTWSQEWELEEHAHCDLIHHRVGGQIGTAVITYEAGRLLRRDRTTFDDYPPLRGSRLWVKIEFPTERGLEPYKWYGIIAHRQTKPLGGDAYDQVINCRGVEWILTRHQLGASYVKQGGISKRVERAITFNENIGNRGSFIQRANRTTAVGPQGAHLFEETLDTAKLWRGSDILTYLAAYFQPMEGNAPRFLFDSSLELLDWYTPTLDVTGQSLFEVFNALIDPKRGVTWSVEVDEETPQFVCKLHSFSWSNVSLPGGATLHKNANQKRVDVNDKKDAIVTFSDDLQRQYEQVIVRGAKRTGTGTWSIADNTLEAAWSPADETAYKRGDPAIATASTLRTEEAAMRHDAYRNQESIRLVYTSFTVPTDWVGNLPNADSSVVQAEACPELDDLGLPFGDTVEFWRPGLKWLPILPLLEGVDYTDIFDIPESPNPIPKFRRPFVTFDNNWTSVFREFGHKLQSGAYTESIGDGGIEFTTHLRLIDGLNVLVQPTAASHCIALNSFDWRTQSAGTGFTEHFAQIDWRKMKLTATVEFDAYCEGRYPIDADVPPGKHDTVSRMVIYVGERARLDWVAKGTEIDLDAGAPVVPKGAGNLPEGFFVRDDREYVERTARAIYEWFATSRQAITLKLQGQLNGQFDLGDLITELDTDEINSLVTGITWDFLEGSTTISTSFADLDFVRLT